MATETMTLSAQEDALTTNDQDLGLPPSKYLCLTILGYRKAGMSEEAYRRHMNEVSAPLTKDLMTRALMTQLFDRQMANVADYDCFSQVVFQSLEHYKAMKADPYYKEHLFNDYENFADTKRSLMTIGWIEEWTNDGQVRESMDKPWVSMTE
ncbi:hypothetical protein H2201_008524 [Coniosporium apollinis]|uniref:EthD domain-containing protein n=1 Tax=Coniosporium apollinis TaxID=61459 RepID=A0ABQ9NGR3_9PEZI|nr:hypothetical protein H2201_008524 [Coniosporium apollinis]